MRAGFSKVRISPEAGAPLCGFAARKAASSGIHDDLYVRALVLDNGRAAVALVSVEVLAVGDSMVEEARRRVFARTGIEPGAVLIAATHTHSGPVTLKSFFNTDQEVDPAYVERLIESAAAAVEGAWNSRFEAVVGLGTGTIQGIGANRRSPDRMPVDETVGVIRVAEPAGNTRAILLHYACHLTVLGPGNTLVSGDLAGAALRRIEAGLGPGGFAMYLNGAEGNVSVGHSPGLSAIGISTPDRTFERAAELGAQLAGVTLAVAACVEGAAGPELGFITVPLELECRTFAAPETLREELRRADAELERLTRQGCNGEAMNQARLRQVFARIAGNNAALARECGGRTRVNVQALRIGGSLWAGVPCELFVETALELKRALPYPAFLVGLAGGYFGYVPTGPAFADGGYEVVSARFIPDTADAILAAIRDAATRLHSNAPD